MPRKISAAVIAVLIIICLTQIPDLCYASPATASEKEDRFSLSPIAAPSLSAESAILIDASSGALLCEKNSSARMAMASTTKIMTALVAAENCPLDRIVSVSPNAVGVEGSSIYLYAGEKLTAKDLLYAVLLESANDAAAAIAIEVGGSIDGFCDMMNSKARALGLKDTHFTNPHGLYDEEHYTTAHDLALIAAAALENETVREIVATKKMTVKPIEGNVRVFYNHNKMLSTYEGAIGVKTGFTKKSGRCLVSAAERDGLTLIAVTLNAPDDWSDHTKLLDLGFDNFCSAALVTKGEVCHIMPVMGGTEQYCALASASSLTLTLPKGAENDIRRVVETTCRYGFAPIQSEQEAGRISFYIESKKIASCTLYPDHSIDRADGDVGLLEKIKNIFD